MASLMPRTSKTKKPPNKRPPRPTTKAPGTWTEQDFAGSGLLAYARNSLDKKQQQQNNNNRIVTASQSKSNRSVNRLSRRLQALTKKRTSQKQSSANPSRTKATTPSSDTNNSALAAALLSTLQASQPTANINRQSRRGLALNKNSTWTFSSTLGICCGLGQDIHQHFTKAPTIPKKRMEKKWMKVARTRIC